MRLVGVRVGSQRSQADNSAEDRCKGQEQFWESLRRPIGEAEEDLGSTQEEGKINNSAARRGMGSLGGAMVGDEARKVSRPGLPSPKTRQKPQSPEENHPAAVLCTARPHLPHSSLLAALRLGREQEEEAEAGPTGLCIKASSRHTLVCHPW